METKDSLSTGTAKAEIQEPPSTLLFAVEDIDEGDTEEPPPSERASENNPYPQLFPSLFKEKESSDRTVSIHKQASTIKTRSFRRLYYPSISTAQWNDWRWQIQNRIRTAEQLARFLKLSDEEVQALTYSGGCLPLSITPYYASLLKAKNPDHPLRRSVVPVVNEFYRSAGESDDPLHEDNDSPVPGLVHRYPDRVLFLATDFCSTYCRYCTRSRMVGRSADRESGKSHWESAIAYIEATPSIRDVLVSGGDPLTLPDESLEWILSRLRRIPHVEIIRIGTKVPAVLPQRITMKLVNMLKKYHPLWINIHFTHPEEITPEVNLACTRLANAGIPLGSQTVLLKGVNDDAAVMKDLYHRLLTCRVRPYYLYQCDPISGSSHFRTPVEKGLEIIEGLRGHTTGFAVPQYVIDAPGGGGKIPLIPDYYQGRAGSDVVLRNYEQLRFKYPDTAV
jgi:lysine 2,3-aminomutase